MFHVTKEAHNFFFITITSTLTCAIGLGWMCRVVVVVVAGISLTTEIPDTVQCSANKGGNGMMMRMMITKAVMA